MAAVGEELPASVGEQGTREPENQMTASAPPPAPVSDTEMIEDRHGIENGQIVGAKEAASTADGAVSEDDPLNNENKKPAPAPAPTSIETESETEAETGTITAAATAATATATATAAYLPSPLSSPAHDDFESSAAPSTSAPNGHAHSPWRLGLIDTSVTGMGLDLSNGVISCAVSEADTDAPNSAVESSTEALPFSPDAQGTPRKEFARTSSSVRRTRDRSGTKSSDHSGVRRLSASKIQELTASPDSLPVAPIREQPLSAGAAETATRTSMAAQLAGPIPPYRAFDKPESSRSEAFGDTPSSRTMHSERPLVSSRTLSTPAHHRKSGSQPPGGLPPSTRRNSFQPSPRPVPLNLEAGSNFITPEAPKSHVSDAQSRHEPPRDLRDARDPRAPSPMPPSFPIPPLSAPTFLQLELAAQRPSPLYVYQSYGGDVPYESSAVKFERLKNFLLLPPYLERTLIIGALACLDAWLWTITILPMRFLLAVKVLVSWWGYVIAKEVRWLIGFVWEGLGRVWERGRRGRGRGMSRRQSLDSSRSSEAASRSPSRAREPLRELSANGASTGYSGPTGDGMRRSESGRSKAGANGNGNGLTLPTIPKSRSRMNGPFHHKRTKSTPSNLSSFHKADLLQFAVIIMSSVLLTQLDASRMYHFIRAQSAVKLYVIYNLVEASDVWPKIQSPADDV